MPTSNPLLQSIQSAPSGLTLTELLAQHPTVARRTVQRWLSQWVAAGQIATQGEGRARRYLPAVARSTSSLGEAGQSFSAPVSLSADSQDILAYVSQPLQARKPVGYQRDFLDAYQPNISAYLSAPLRRQLHNMGKTSRMSEPAGTYSRAILNRLLIDLSWASSHLEGNTYSRLDTVALIEHGRTATGKGAIETQMILNHKSAIELLLDNAAAVALNRFLLMNIHSALAENLLPNPADEGRIRQHAVDIGQSVYCPLSTPQQINEALDVVLAKFNQISDPFEQSFFAMVHLPYLQPFADINKCTSRLAANLPLFRANLCPLTFLDVPEAAYSAATLGVYELTRVELLRDLYVWAYERSTQEYQAIQQDLAEPDPLRLAYRDLIKQTVRQVVQQPQAETLKVIEQALEPVPQADRVDVHALLVQELQRLHEGVLARYGLQPSELVAWKEVQNSLKGQNRPLLRTAQHTIIRK
ncbi:MAG: filamentation induced by cAMP protein fic [Comamonadaceae bacterium]|nr:MAG: filamentation induced by cAMP protein fic [Comamonadaceae bacterium]